MWRFLFISYLILINVNLGYSQTPGPKEQVIDVKDIQQCGLTTRWPGDILAPNCFQNSTNILSDRTGVMTRRNGYSPYNGTPCPGSQPIRGMWPFFAQDGTQYLVMFSSQSMFYSPADGSCNYIPGLKGQFSATATMECVQALGQLWCTDGIDTVFSTNIVSTQPVTQAPTGYHIGTFRNRILISGVPGTGANGSGSQVYLSGELNGYDYTIPAIQLTTSPAIISVNGINDGLIVTCLMGEFQNQFLVGRAYDLWGLSGYNLSDFALRKISSQVGCLEPRSVQEVTNVLYWLSYRGIEGYSGTQINRVSYPIDSTILPIIASAGNTQTKSISSQSEFQAGNLVASGPGAPISATISPGNIVPSSVTNSQNTNALFSLWNSTFTAGIGCSAPGNPSGNCFILDSNSLKSFGTGAGVSSTSPIVDLGLSTPIVTCSMTHTNYADNGSFLQTMSVSFSSYSSGGFGDTIICISTQVTSGDSGVSTVLGTVPGSQKRYAKIRFSNIYTGGALGANAPSIGPVSLIAETTGYYITPCILVSSPTSYGNFLVNGQNNDGSFSFGISTGATCSAAISVNATFNSQVPNSIITASTGVSYISARILFTIDAATEVPTINDITFTWNNGASRPPTASARWDDRYLLFYTSSTATGAVNDHVIIYDQNQKWQLWDDEHAASATLYLNNLYTGDSNPTGTVYQQDVGQDDNGNPYTMVFQSADFDGGDPNMNKQFSRSYLMISAPNNNNGSASLSCNYAIDGSSLTYSLGSVILSQAPQSTGYFVAKMPFPATNPVTGHWVNLTCSFNGAVGPIVVHRIRLVFVPQSWD